MKVVLTLLFAISAVAFATKSIDVPLVYTTAARTVPYTHAAQTYTVETVPTTVQTASVVPVAPGNPSSQYHAQDSSGQYSYGYATADGQTKVENKAADGTVSGQYSYFDPEGKKVELSYIADEGGFRASGNRIPVAPEVPDLPDSLEDAYEEASERLASARYKALVASPQTYSYNVQPASYVTYPATTRGFQYYTNAGAGYYPGYVQRYTYGAPAVAGYQRYSTGYPVVSGYQRYSTGYPAVQYYSTSGTPTGYQYYTAGKPTGFQYITSSYAPGYTTYPASYSYNPTRYIYSPTRYSYTPTRYTGGKSSDYSRFAYSY